METRCLLSDHASKKLDRSPCLLHRSKDERNRRGEKKRKRTGRNQKRRNQVLTRVETHTIFHLLQVVRGKTYIINRFINQNANWESYMKHAVYHIVIPAIMPGLFLITAATPVEVLGCRTRGLIARTIALVSGLAAIGTAMIGARGRMKETESSL
jgi:hypothetical protein